MPHFETEAGTAHTKTKDTSGAAVAELRYQWFWHHYLHHTEGEQKYLRLRKHSSKPVFQPKFSYHQAPTTAGQAAGREHPGHGVGVHGFDHDANRDQEKTKSLEPGAQAMPCPCVWKAPYSEAPY